MKWAILLLSLVSLASARQSPHADLVKQLAESPEGARYSNDVYKDAYLDVPGLITKYGYPLEVHHVLTSDGYILEMHRIPYGRKNQQKDRIPVLIMHGLLCSSADWVFLGPGTAMAYYLADLGYDVWLGNARGNYYSRRHIRLNPDNLLNTKFWEFSWDEIGYYDLPAFIDRIVSVTGRKLHYIGHSQGGTSFLVMASRRPEYNEKLISFQGLAPASFFIYNDDVIINSLAPLEAAWFTVPTGEVLPNLEITTDFGFVFCADGSLTQELCLTFPVIGPQIRGINATTLPLILGHTPAGSSIRQVTHYAQNVNSKRFRRYDYGTLTNLITYGSRNPPEYDLSKVSAPTYLYYGLSDTLVNPNDVKVLAERLPNLKSIRGMERTSFTHLDFMWAVDVREQLYSELERTLRDAEKNHH